jgi:hypothetical protein
MEIENSTVKEVELDKRTHAPVVLRSTCPNCGHLCEEDLSDKQSYLSYPRTNRPFVYNFYCVKCDHEWDEGEVILRMSIEKV